MSALTDRLRLAELSDERLAELAHGVAHRVARWLLVAAVLLVAGLWADWRFLVLELVPLVQLTLYGLASGAVDAERQRRRGAP